MCVLKLCEHFVILWLKHDQVLISIECKLGSRADLYSEKMDLGEGGDGSEAKRRKAFTKRETLQKLEELGNNVSKAVSEMVSDLSPFEVNGENVTAYEENIEKLDKVASSLTSKIYRLKTDVKAKKFWKRPDLLDETIISCSQHMQYHAIP